MRFQHGPPFRCRRVSFLEQLYVALNIDQWYPGAKPTEQALNEANILLRIAPVPILSPSDWHEDANPFVIAQCMNGQSGHFRGFLNGKRVLFCIHNGQSTPSSRL